MKSIWRSSEEEKIKLFSDYILQVLLVQHISYIQVNTEQLIQ